MALAPMPQTIGMGQSPQVIELQQEGGNQVAPKGQDTVNEHCQYCNKETDQIPENEPMDCLCNTCCHCLCIGCSCYQEGGIPKSRNKLLYVIACPLRWIGINAVDMKRQHCTECKKNVNHGKLGCFGAGCWYCCCGCTSCKTCCPCVGPHELGE